MNKLIPKNILLITETPPSEKGTGASQTLYNLFENYGNTKLSVVSPSHILKSTPVSEKLSNHSIGFKTFFFKGKLMKILGSKVPEQINKIAFRFFSLKKVLAIAAQTKPDLIFISNADYYAVKVSFELIKKYNVPFYIYLQDNINESISLSHQKRVEYLMKKSQGWLLISEYMYEDVLKKYAFPDKPYLIVHNPVKKEAVRQVKFERLSEDWNIIYAGAIWPMHFDALEKFVLALQYLKQVKVNLKIYTQKYFWDTYALFFEQHHVIYGGFLLFKELQSKLISADALLVTSSFSKEAEVLTRFSVQTKITDYMAAGVPIISVGPEYSACNLFIEKKNVGTVIKNNNPEWIADQLSVFLKTYNERLKIAQNAHELVLKEHTQEIVEQKLFNFILRGIK